MTLSPETLATVLRRILDRTEPMQADLEDVLLAEQTTEILAGEGFDPAKVFKAASEFAFAIRSAAQVNAAQIEDPAGDVALRDDDFAAYQQVFL